jgi:predicted nucleic acid-binding protein
MRSLGIREALAFDGDFAAAGFVELSAIADAPGSP